MCKALWEALSINAEANGVVMLLVLSILTFRLALLLTSCGTLGKLLNLSDFSSVKKEKGVILIPALSNSQAVL